MATATDPHTGTRAGTVGLLLPRDLPAHQVLDFAREAERLGADQLWVVEDLGYRGGVAQATAALAATTTLHVGVGILPAGARNAAFAAMELATLAQLFPGRVTAGIGHGMPEWMRSAGAWPDSPLTLLREHAAAVRALLAGHPGPAAGRYVDVSGVVLTEVPDVVPPVLLGVRGPRSLAAAAEVADGVVLAEPAPPTYVREALSAMRSGETAPPTDPTVVTYDLAVVRGRRQDAVEQVRAGLAVVGEPAWAPHLVGLPFRAELEQLAGRCSSPADLAAHLPAEWVAELALAGTVDDVRDGLRRRHAAGATCVVLTPVGSDPLAELEHLAPALGAGG